MTGRKQRICLFKFYSLSPALRLRQLFRYIHVGNISLTSDYDGIDSIISGLKDVTTFAALVRSLFLTYLLYYSLTHGSASFHRLLSCTRVVKR